MTASRLLTVPFVLLLAAATSCSGADDDASAPATTTTADSVVDSRAQDAEPPVTDTACEGDEPPSGSRADFRELYCSQIAEVEDLYGILDLPVATATQLELLRVSVCAPDAQIPDRDQSELSFGSFIRGSAEQNPTLGERWLGAGVLDVFERTDNDDGTFVVDLEFDDETIGRLADAEQGLFEAVVAEPAVYCDT